MGETFLMESEGTVEARIIARLQATIGKSNGSLQHDRIRQCSVPAPPGQSPAAHRPHGWDWKYARSTAAFWIWRRLPDELRALEPSLRSLLTAQLKRGKVSCAPPLNTTRPVPCPAPRPACCSASTRCKTTCRPGCPRQLGSERGRCLRLCAGSQPPTQDWSTIASGWRSPG